MSGNWDTGISYEDGTRTLTPKATVDPAVQLSFCRACRSPMVLLALQVDGKEEVPTFTCPNQECQGSVGKRPHTSARCFCGHTRPKFHKSTRSYLCEVHMDEQNQRVAKEQERLYRSVPTSTFCPGCGRPNPGKHGHGRNCQFMFSGSNTHLSSLPGC